MQGMRASEQGKMEERLPFLAVRIPRWFADKYPQAALSLHSNADRLTTPFDLHETLKDVLDMQRSRTNLTEGTPRSYSLFQDIPDNRTCADAAIESHWLELCFLIFVHFVSKNAQTVKGYSSKL